MLTVDNAIKKDILKKKQKNKKAGQPVVFITSQKHKVGVDKGRRLPSEGTSAL